MPEMIVANRLSDGRVVYLDAQGGWTQAFAQGAVIDSAEAKSAALATSAQAVAQNLIVDPYPIELEHRAGHLAPKGLRETIRAQGPTVSF